VPFQKKDWEDQGLLQPMSKHLSFFISTTKGKLFVTSDADYSKCAGQVGLSLKSLIKLPFFFFTGQHSQLLRSFLHFYNKRKTFVTSDTDYPSYWSSGIESKKFD